MSRSVVLNTDLITYATLEELRSGSQTAFETIYLKYSHKITNFIFSTIKSFEDAEEISQEIFTYLWQNREKIDTGKSINSYLYILAKYNILNYFRRKKVHEAYMKDASHADCFESAGLDELMHVKEVKLMIELAVSGMPQQRQKIYRMSRNEGISNDEIAQQLGIAKNTVEKHLSFALKDIREIMMLYILIFVQSSFG